MFKLLHQYILFVSIFILLFQYGLSQETEYSSLYYTAGSYCLSTPYTVCIFYLYLSD